MGAVAGLITYDSQISNSPKPQNPKSQNLQTTKIEKHIESRRTPGGFTVIALCEKLGSLLVQIVRSRVHIG